MNNKNVLLLTLLDWFCRRGLLLKLPRTSTKRTTR